MTGILTDKDLDSVVYLLRHGERIDQIDPSWIHTADAPFDPPLTDLGILQATTSANFIRDDIEQNNVADPHDAIILASPFYRTLQTAHAIADALSPNHTARPTLELFPHLAEWLAKDYFPEPLPHDPFTYANRAAQFSFLDPPSTPDFDESSPIPSYPESREQMRTRFLDALRYAVQNYHKPKTPIIMVSHGAGCQAMPEELAAAGILDPPHLKLPETPYCCITKLVKKAGDPRWTAEISASVAHLEGLLERTGLEFVVGGKHPAGGGAGPTGH